MNLRKCRRRRTQSSKSLNHGVVGELPDEIVELILLKSNLRDAVRGTPVSRRWREIAISSILRSETLVLSSMTIFGSDRPFDCECHVKTLRSNKLLAVQRKEKFVAAVNQFLGFLCNQYLHRNEELRMTTISAFRVEFCLPFSISDDIDRWIDYATGDLGIRNICLHLQCGISAARNRERDPTTLDKCGKFVISSSKIFYCNADKLRLSACRLQPNLFVLEQQFSVSLKALRLFNMPLADYDIETMFRSLVMLETLNFTRCSLPSELCIHSLPTLRTLVVFYCPNTRVIQMSNKSKLTCFTCNGHEEILWDLSGARNLESLVIALDATGANYYLNNGSKNFPMLSEFYMVLTSEADGLACISYPIPVWATIRKFYLNLRTPKPFDIGKMIAVIRAFPNLQKLRVQMDFKDFLETDNVQIDDYSILHLEEVKLRTSHITANLLQFADYLVRNAISLKRLIFERIHFSEPWEKGSIQKLPELHKLFLNKSCVLSLCLEKTKKSSDWRR